MLRPWCSGWCPQMKPPAVPRINTPAKKEKSCCGCDLSGVTCIMFRFSAKRKDSAIRTLVAETLVLAKTHGYVEKIEHELEEELQRENTEPPNRILAKWRRNGEKLLKNKYTLLTVALFCVTECALILGELILDLHKVKDVLEDQEKESIQFIKSLNNKYPNHIRPEHVISAVYENILRSQILWHESIPSVSNDSSLKYVKSDIGDNETRHRRAADYEQTMVVLPPEIFHSNNSTGKIGSSYRTVEGSSSHLDHSDNDKEHSLEEAIAHAFHKASITILSILVFETILKALCAGTAFFQRKLETFDLCVVLISFVVDLVCMQIMPRYKIQDFVFILAFLLPWRVIRVVNSLVVAVQDHEHFRLKLIYGRKKKIVNSLRESEIKLQLFRAQCNALKRLCFNEGIDESKIDQILMVEECVVNKAGKSKCKIKIDNSSVILLNDKSDFPRLSPRPSLLNLVEKVGRRKSMQPQAAPGSDRDLFTNAKDSPKKGILKFRARSNSESGRGTLNSPDDLLSHHNGIGDLGIFGGLNTPIIINRKSSLSSPIMANHVRNILNSLEDRVNQMNGSCSRMATGRGSIDANSIAEEVEDFYPTKRFGRRVHSIDETTERNLEKEYKNMSHASKRRASLQPQRCVDEDDIVMVEIKPLAGPSRAPDLKSTSGPSSSRNTMSVNETRGENATVHCQKFSPTTIQIDPPSVHSSYSLSSSSSSNSSNNKHFASGQPQSGISSPLNGKKSPENSPVLPHSSTTFSHVLQPHIVASPSSETMVPEREIQPNNYEMITMPVPASLKPKTLRTPSDVENQNSLTQSIDTCESQSNDADTRTTSIEEIEDDFENSDCVVSISNTDDSVLSGTRLESDRRQANMKPELGQQGAKGGCSPSFVPTESNGSVGNFSRNAKDVKRCPSVKRPSAETSEMELKSDSVTNLLS